ncbi:MAG: sensor histidine kinase [Cellulosilyticaceae bacterium]
MKQSIKTLYSKTSIKTKWIIFVLILIIYPMFLLGYVGYKNYEEEVTSHFVESVQKDIMLVSELVLERLQDIEKIVAETQYDEAIYDFSTDYYEMIKRENINLETISHDKEQLAKLEQVVKQDYDLKSKVERYLKSVVLSRQDISIGAFQFIEQGESGYIVSKEQSNAYYEQKNFNENKIFNKIKIELNKGYTTAYYIDQNRNFYIGQKLFYRDNFEHSANIIFKIDQEYVFKRFHNMLGESKQGVYVVANATKDLVTLGELDEERRHKLERFILSNHRGGSYYTEESKGEAVVYNMFNTKNLSIASAVFIELNILLANIREMSGFIFMLCMSMIPVFLVVANKLYKEVIYPVYILSGKMQQIEQGEMGVEIISERKDEIGYVYSAFNKMSKEIKYLVNCVYKEQIALKNAELKSLQAQINPHFLYNTLEMINWKARMSGNEDISEMIEALSGIMEINIDRRQNQFLTIEEEIKYLRNYIFLIQKRFGDKIKLEECIDEKTFDFKIPRLLIQPIIENAIGHGIEPVGRGTIFLTIEQREGNLMIFIRDNGQGMSYARLNSLKEQLEVVKKNYIEDEELGKSHIGIINVQRRIKLLYGEKYGIDIKSEENEGTEVILLLPAHLDEKDTREIG